MPSTVTWRFRAIEDDQKHVEPTHREHLAPGGAVEPLVREAIQNSLDVTVEGRPTKVAFTLGVASAAAARPYFQDLHPHLEAIARALPDGPPIVGEPIRYLTIEDYNTTGLVGDPTVRKELNPDGSKNHYFRFWHRIGPATEFKRRGSWGVGKVVFANASKIRTFFGVTLRQNETNPLLMGEAGLTIHTLPDADVDYDWYGYFARHELRQNAAGRERQLILPIDDAAVTARFSQVFSVRRNEAGLSIVVPYVRDEVELDSLAKAVIEQYFLPILSGRMEVVIREGAREILLSHSTIEDVIPHLTWSNGGASSQSEVSALLELARWQISHPIDEYTLLASEGADGPYTLESDRFPENSLVRLSDEFATNKRIALRIPVRVSPVGGAPIEEEIRVVLERDEDLRTSNVPHLRSGINISKMRSQALVGTRGILLVGIDPETQGPLDKLLQASEGPAHMNWEQRGEGYDKAKSLYQDAYKTIGFMRHLVRRLVELMSAPQEERDLRTLSVYFPDYAEDGIADGGGRGERRGPGPEDEGTPPPLPAGVVLCVVRALLPALGGMRPVEAACVKVCAIDGTTEAVAETNAAGEVRFDGLPAGEFQIVAQKEGIGEAQKTFLAAADVGTLIEVILRPASKAKLFSKVRLDNGFAIRGNSDFQGQLRPIRVRLAYAAWGGSKSHDTADFDLTDSRLRIESDGLRETQRSEFVVSPNVLRFTPTAPNFFVEVRGFDVNRALHVDARALEETAADGGED